MHRVFLVGLVQILALLGAASSEPASPSLGASWFARLRAPESRLAALRAWEQHVRAPEDAASPFPEHPLPRVLRCPQETIPDAWLVLWQRDDHLAEEALLGPDPDAYPPASVAVEREYAREIALRKRDEDGIVWVHGDPWLQSVYWFLTAPSGTVVGGEQFLDCGVIADADADGELDLVEFSSIRFRGDAPADRPLADLVTLGPVDPEAPRRFALVANFRGLGNAVTREWKFDLRPRGTDPGLDLWLVSTADSDPFESERPIEFRAMPAAPSRLPDSVSTWEPGGASLDEHLAALGRERFGWKQCSPSRDPVDATLLRADELPQLQLPTGPTAFAAPPSLLEMNPDDAALALVDHNRNAAHRANFDLVLETPSPSLPSAGWISLLKEPGWGPPTVEIWWLRGDQAEYWALPAEADPVDLTSALTGPVDPLPLARSIALLLALDRVRTIPLRPESRSLHHDCFGGDDHEAFTVTAHAWTPRSEHAAFEVAFPTLWNALRGPYDRPAAGLMAAVFLERPAAISPQELVRRQFSERAEEWFSPDVIATVPAPLLRPVLLAVGAQARHELRPALEELLRVWGPPTEKEEELRHARAEAASAKEALWRGPHDPSWQPERVYRASVNDVRTREQQLASDPAVQFRESVEAALRRMAEAEALHRPGPNPANKG